MKYFKAIRIAYVEDLVLPPPPHDFERAVSNGQDDPWLTTDGSAIVSAKTLRIHKSSVRFYDNADGIYYSPSLNVAVYEQASDGYSVSDEPALSNEQLDLILSWVFKNWATAKNRQLVKLNEIF